MTTRRVLASNVNPPIVLSPSDRVYTNHTGTHIPDYSSNFPDHMQTTNGIKQTITINLHEWPHITEAGIEKYEKKVKVTHDLTNVGADILEHPVHHMSYPFPLNESNTFMGLIYQKGVGLLLCIIALEPITR